MADPLEEAIRFFERGDSMEVKTFKNGHLDRLNVLESAVHDVENEERGLSEAQISRLIQAITTVRVKGKTRTGFRIASDACVMNLTSPSSSRLISCLVPNSKISGETACDFTLWVITNWRKLQVKCALDPALRWINCVLHYNVCPITQIQALYECFFPLLNLSSVRNIVLDILFKLTENQKRFVTKYRMKALLDLQLRDAKNNQLDSLLCRYEALRPDLLSKTTKVRKTKRASCKPRFASSKMEKSFAAIWNSRSSDDSSDAPLDFLSLEHLDKGTLASKRFRPTLIPPLTEEFISSPPSKRRKLGEASSSAELVPNKLVSIHECRSVSDIVSNATKLTNVSQAMTLLSSPNTFYYLLLNSEGAKMQERLSLTLYYTLHNEFFSMSRTREPNNRKLKLLVRINQLQDWLQQGIPVVGRFLAQYLTIWNGSDYFIEICKMLVYLQITDFSEFHECILQPIHSLFNSKFTTVSQLLMLNYLNRLALHWATIDYQRSKKGLDDGLFPMANSTCEDSLGSLDRLIEFISQLVENGLCKLVRKWPGLNFEQAQELPREMNVYIQESLTLSLTLSRCLVKEQIPIRPNLPSSVIYFSFFGRNVTFIARCLEYITMVKQDMVPMCERIAKQLEQKGDIFGHTVASSQVNRLDSLNAAAKDVLALCTSLKHLPKGESIFRQHWRLEDESIRLGLSTTTHPAFIPYVRRFCALEGEQNQAQAFREIQDTSSTSFEEYLKFVARYLPQVSEFMQVFNSKALRSAPKLSLESHNAHTLGEGSPSTSGISSMRTNELH